MNATIENSTVNSSKAVVTTYRTFWQVNQGVWGKDQPTMLTFDSKKAAEDYYNSSNYCDWMGHKTFRNESSIKAMELAVKNTKNTIDCCDW